jgi:uncharacterized RDD family membrane protein YckC
VSTRAVEAHAGPAVSPLTPSLRGHYAGIASRVAAYVIDAVVVLGIYTITTSMLTFVVVLVTGVEINLSFSLQIGASAGLILWAIIYDWYGLAVFGRTPGKALMGLIVTRGDGADLRRGRAFLRAVLRPLLIAVTLGLELVGVVIGQRHRALHDVLADTVVTYEWDARASRGLIGAATKAMRRPETAATDTSTSR